MYLTLTDVKDWALDSAWTLDIWPVSQSNGQKCVYRYAGLTDKWAMAD